tara:strand:+ start:117 stop:920 length:804 start_codon:yes stop_codon:yes gene_type:complete
MQKRRSVRKVIQEPIFTQNVRTNIQRRNDERSAVRTTNNQAIAANITKIQHSLKNAAEEKPRTVRYSYVPKLFPNETIFIVGGGPSLKGFDFRSLYGKRTIAINKALIYVTDPDVVYWTDGRFYTWFKNEVDSFKGLKFALKPGSQYTSDIKILRKGKPYGLEIDPETLAHGFNSGYAAINLAYHLGAKRIVLLGFDMAEDGKDTHFHDGYPTRSSGDKVYKEKFLPGFKQLYDELKGTGVEVINASPNSRLKVFPKITLNQAASLR